MHLVILKQSYIVRINKKWSSDITFVYFEGLVCSFLICAIFVRFVFRVMLCLKINFGIFPFFNSLEVPKLKLSVMGSL